MAYNSSDPRSQLAGQSPGTGEGDIAQPGYFAFRDFEPTDERTWYVRGQNLVLSYSSLEAGQELTRHAEKHEYAVILPDDDGYVDVQTPDGREELRGAGLIVVPPGDSTVRALRPTSAIRLFDTSADDLVELALNAADYAEPHPRVALLERWPAPSEDRLRIYPLDEVPTDPERFGRIFRTRAFMVNFLPDQLGPRNPENLSPHHHDDFEQISLAVEGEWMHHIRTPWTSQRSQWREDEHHTITSPSVTIIPPPTVHTSEARGQGRNRLIDIFSPPRLDFSEKPGWVLNAEEYPAP
jgi:mannose-6-phosphate isomerase-like protein (cupin superfamily)